MPSTDVARSALEKTLEAWKSGAKHGELGSTDPVIQAVDSDWRSGKALSSFEILNEEESASERRFTVKLVYAEAVAKNKTKENTGTTADARYVVLGKGPVLVYREEDYQRMLNMDNNPATSKSGKRSR